jgi:cyclohexadieny/prephenate dehydrogenase
MERVVGRLAIIGQGLIGSSITRAAREYAAADQIVVTDASPKIRKTVLGLGLGNAKVVDTNSEAVGNADLVVLCVPVGQMSAVASEIGGLLRQNCILTDVGSVKRSVIDDVMPHLRPDVHFIPAHPLAGTENSGPENGMADLFFERWCILTPPEGADADSVDRLKAFWRALGSHVETMTPRHHDYVLSITSHIPHLIAFTIFHTALRHERISDSEVMKFSAGGFRDFTRIASSNPTMWRDIFLRNKEAILDVLSEFNADLQSLSEAIRRDDGEKIFHDLSTSRLTRRKIIEREHISVKQRKALKDQTARISRPYSQDE